MFNPRARRRSSAGREVGRVGDGCENEVVSEEAPGNYLGPPGELLGEEVRGCRLDLDAREVDEDESVLLCKRLGEDLRGDDAALDENLADAPSRLGLLLRERFLEVLPAQPAGVHQQLA